MTGLPLSRFTVVDLTRVRSGPTAVRQFSDWGAKVIKVEDIDAALVTERRGGDFENLHRNKSGIALDLKSDKGRQILYKLVEKADVVIENFRPSVKFRLGVDYETLRKLNPRLVYASISGFGQTGPYADRPGLDQVAQGMGGIMAVTGLPGQGPVRAGAAVSDVGAGLFCALGVLTALLEREVTGEGRWVQTSLLQAQIAIMDFQAARWLVDGEVPDQQGNDHPTAVPMGLFPTADGSVNIAPVDNTMYEKLCHTLGAPQLAADERFATRKSRAAHRALVNEELSKFTRLETSATWVERLNAAGVPCGPVYRMDEVFADPQVRHLGIACEVEDPKRPHISVVGQAFTLSGVEPQYGRRAPDHGEHTDEVLQAVGLSQAEIAELRQQRVVA